jgi:hypothetical protein
LRAFVIDVERAAAALDRAVIDHRHTRRCDTLPDAPGERARALAIEVAFEAVPDRLVQEDARPAVTQHNGGVAGGRVTRAEIEQRLIDRTMRVVGGELVGEHAVVGAPATTGGALLPSAVLLDDDVHRQAHERTHVGGDEAVAARHQNGFVFAGERCHHLHDAWIARAGHLLDALEQRHFRSVG